MDNLQTQLEQLLAEATLREAALHTESDEDIRTAIQAKLTKLRKDISALQLRLPGDGAASATLNSATNNSGIAVQGSTVAGSVVGRDLIQIIHQTIDEAPALAQEAIGQYLAALVKDCTRLKLSAVDQAAARATRTPLELADVYVRSHADSARLI